MKEKRKSKAGRNPKLDPAVYRYTVRFNEEEHNRFLAMFGKSGVYARSVFLKAHFFGQPFKVLKVDKTLVDYYTCLLYTSPSPRDRSLSRMPSSA